MSAEMHLVGCFEWMHTVGFGPLDMEDDDGAAQTGGQHGRPAQPQAAADINGGAGAPAGASEGAAGVAIPAPCPDCGQLAMVAVGRCACQVVEVERV